LARYPGTIAGLVLIDASSPKQLELLPERIRKSRDHYIEQLYWDRWQAQFGITRIRGKCGIGGRGASIPWSPADDDCIPLSIDTTRREAMAFSASAAEALHTGPFTKLPILIISRDPALRTPGTPESDQAEHAYAWEQMQAELMRLSPLSRRVIALRSSHHIEWTRPELVIREISRFVHQLRGEDAEPISWGSTDSR
jgi:hypothetical protein